MSLSFHNLKEWAESHSLWLYQAGLSCCTLEFLSAGSPRYDWERFGCTPVSDPGNADVLIIAGPVVESMREEIRKVYDQMRTPKYVISMGSCANTGGMFAEHSHTVVGGLESVIPVDLYVPGCPPRPETLIHAMLSLQKKIQRSATA